MYIVVASHENSSFVRVLSRAVPVFLTGVAFSKHIVHIYAYNGGSDLRQHLEVCLNISRLDYICFHFFLTLRTVSFPPSALIIHC